MTELRNMDSNKKWVQEINNWLNENNEIENMDSIDAIKSVMNWMINKLDEYDKKLDSGNEM